MVWFILMQVVTNVGITEREFVGRKAFRARLKLAKILVHRQIQLTLFMPTSVQVYMHSLIIENSIHQFIYSSLEKISNAYKGQLSPIYHIRS